MSMRRLAEPHGSGFDFLNPAWERLPPVCVRGPARPLGDGRYCFETSDGPLAVTPIADGVRINLGHHEKPDYGILAGAPKPVAAELEEAEGETRFLWGENRLVIRHEPLAFDLRRDGDRLLRSPSDGHFVREFRLPPFARVRDGWLAVIDLPSGAPVYGLGEKWGPLDKRGQLIHSVTHDALGVNSERSYKNCPFAWSPAGWGVFVHTPAAVHHAIAFAHWSNRSYGLYVEDEALDLFVFTGATPAAIIERYTRLTGRPAMPPLWSLGVILSKAYYRDAEELLAAARAVRERGMPCDTITLDGRAWQDTPTRFHFSFDPSRYPQPAEVIAEVKRLGFRLCIWEYPLVSFTGPHFAELAARGWLLKDASGKPYRFRFDPEPFGAVLTQLPDSAVIDLTHPDAYAWWRERNEELFRLGVDMVKTDFGEQVEHGMRAANGDTGERLHNVYPLLYNRCVFEAAQRAAEGGACLLGRAGWAGSQRYPAQWGGDPQADWEGLAASIRGGLSWAMSGAACYATDIGGFYGDRRDAELFVRWTQAAVFSSHMRFHGIGDRTPWSYGGEAFACVMDALKLRYRLLPYLWATLREACATGLPVQRAMAVACPDEPEAWGFEEQFFFGPDILVAPVLGPGGRVRAYLPEGRWHPLQGGAALEGGRTHRLTLGPGEIAAFVREGAEIPFGPEVETTAGLGAEPPVERVRRFG